jgi:hypothetical protein
VKHEEGSTGKRRHACLDCGAAAGEKCVTKSGKPVEYIHISRTNQNMPYFEKRR